MSGVWSSAQSNADSGDGEPYIALVFYQVFYFLHLDSYQGCISL